MGNRLKGWKEKRRSKKERKKREKEEKEREKREKEENEKREKEQSEVESLIDEIEENEGFFGLICDEKDEEIAVDVPKDICEVKNEDIDVGTSKEINVGVPEETDEAKDEEVDVGLHEQIEDINVDVGTPEIIDDGKGEEIDVNVPEETAETNDEEIEAETNAEEIDAGVPDEIGEIKNEDIDEGTPEENGEINDKDIDVSISKEIDQIFDENTDVSVPEDKDEVKTEIKEEIKTEEKGKTSPDILLKKLATQKHKKKPKDDVADTVKSKVGRDGSPEDLPEWFEDLTADNESAFKQLFDMLDSAQRGSLTAENLYEGLKRVDSGITREEVDAVMNKLDIDGNGEIDFEEFLIHMTQGGVADDEAQDGKSGKFSKRQRFFYTAMTHYSMKKKLERERRRQPHVIGHYAAGVRLIGLTDRQLARQMKKLMETAKNHDSPYGKLLPFVSQSSRTHSSKKRKATERKDIGPEESMTPEPERPQTGGSWKENWKNFARKITAGQTDQDPIYSIRTTLKKEVTFQKIATTVQKKKKRVEKRSIPQIGKCTVPLPVLKVKSTKHWPTMDDLPNIREQTRFALDEYYHKLRAEFVKNSYEHWDKLYADSIRPKKLLENFRKVYRAYQPHTEREAIVVSPWMPGANPYVHRKVVSRVRPFSAS